ncbi:DUF6907 domain-containing protein [Streptomyces sp. NPDC057456]|uniref:DUF6907 domain-containing protein n=1 Tax=Streptomyces sp. NPDC057456 TaxID=3346139 RepID=UPI003682B07F
MADLSMPSCGGDTTPLPTFGPTDVIPADENAEPFAVVKVALTLTRDQLRAALAIGHAELAAEPPLPDMGVLDVRREVEGYLAAGAIFELEREAGAMRLPADLVAELDAAIDRAYTRPASTARAQAPRYRDGTVILDTLDHGEVTIPEPAWCTGHDGELVGHLADVTHNGRPVKAGANTEELGHVEIMTAYISHAPHAVLHAEPHPLLSLHLDVNVDVSPADGQQVAQGLRVASLRLDRVLGEVARLRGGLS